MKTAIQKAKTKIAELWSSPSDTPTYSQIFDILDNSEIEEKQQIIDACNYGKIYNKRFDYDSEQYYSETFKND